MDIVVILILAALVEAVIASISMVVQHKEAYWENVVAAILGGALTYVLGFDLLGILGLEAINGPAWSAAVLNAFLTGILLMRGSAGVNDLYERISKLRGNP